MQLWLFLVKIWEKLIKYIINLSKHKATKYEYYAYPLRLKMQILQIK